LEGKGRKDLQNKERVRGRIEDIGMKGFGGLIFLQNIKPSLFGELKNCIGGGFI
jgi:hypothetical protein